MNVAELERQIEYKFAPEPLLAVQALANTFDPETEEERLLNVDSTRRWLVDSGLAVAGVDVGDRERATLLELRTVVRALLDANLTGENDPEAIAALGRLAAAHPVPVAADDEGRIDIDLEPAPTVEGAVAQLIGIVLRAQIDGTWPRLKVCAADECRWAFYDSSRNRGGNWCKMEICGNRMKNRSYRARLNAAG